MMKTQDSKAFPVLYPDAAGIDIGSTSHWVAVNPGSDSQPVREFGAFTSDLQQLSLWLRQCGVNTIAMEATGVYWVSLYLLLEKDGFEVLLVNARHVKNVRGKKTDMKDAEWIRQLHSCGLLSASFQPDGFTRQLRTYMRHRKNLVEMGATHIRMMQKAMEQMNLKLQHVIADITGKSGLAIISAILAGERDGSRLAGLADGRVKATAEQVRKSLEGVWKEEHLFELQQSFDLYHIYRQKQLECDGQIERLLKEEFPGASDGPRPEGKPRSSNKNNLAFDAAATLASVLGTVITEIPGINDSTAVELVSETGTDMDKWPSHHHFTSWLNLAPNNKISGGKLLSSKIPKKKNRAGQIFRMAAFAVQRTKNWLSVFYHKIKSRGGAKKAINATARKIAVIFYQMIKNKTPFNPLSTEEHEAILRKHQLKKATMLAKQLGLQLVAI